MLQTALGFEGAFNSASAGILIYNALVDLIVPAFATSERVFPNGGIVKIVPFLCLYLGFAVRPPNFGRSPQPHAMIRKRG